MADPLSTATAEGKVFISLPGILGCVCMCVCVVFAAEGTNSL